jgi:hypothetical protein
MTFTIQEARELATLAEVMSERLSLARAHWAEANDAPREESTWLEAATRRVKDGLARVQAALAMASAAPLPEFATQRKVKSESLSSAWADAVERVFDGVVANVSANGPLIEALFPHQRFATLRRPGNAAQQFWTEFERRADSTYVKRLCTDPEYGFLSPLLEAAKASQRALLEAASPKAISESQASELRAEVSRAAEGLELALRQARLLAEAAFANTPSQVAELGLDAKPKRRSVRAEPVKAEPGETEPVKAEPS